MTCSLRASPGHSYALSPRMTSLALGATRRHIAPMATHDAFDTILTAAAQGRLTDWGNIARRLILLRGGLPPGPWPGSSRPWSA